MRWIIIPLLLLHLNTSSGSKTEKLELPILVYESDQITIIHMPNVSTGNRQTEIHGYRLYKRKKPPIY